MIVRMKQRTTSRNKQLQHIVDFLVLNGTLIECPGLIHGKIGIAIFFFHYAQHTCNELFEDYAMDIISEIQMQVHNNSLANYERGIAGIGVGMDYLLRNQFLIAEDGLFNDFDQRMYRAVMYDPWQDFSLYEGLTGYGRYWMMRFRQSLNKEQARQCLFHIVGLIYENFSEISSKDQTDVFIFLHDLHQLSSISICNKLLEQSRQWYLQSLNDSMGFPRLGDSAMGRISRIYQHSHYFKNNMNIGDLLKKILDLDMEKLSVGMGLLTGYAGLGMLHLMEITPMDMTWLLLY